MPYVDKAYGLSSRSVSSESQSRLKVISTRSRSSRQPGYMHHFPLVTRASRTRQRSGARSWWRTKPWCWRRPRSRCWRGCSSCRRCRRGSWRGAASRCLDRNHHRRTCLEEADRCIGLLWRLIGVEPEIIQCAPANRVGVLILRKCFRAPGN